MGAGEGVKLAEIVGVGRTFVGVEGTFVEVGVAVMVDVGTMEDVASPVPVGFRISVGTVQAHTMHVVNAKTVHLRNREIVVAMVFAFVIRLIGL